jgi:cobalt-zinc-cadmium efflux system outer membrane protein
LPGAQSAFDAATRGFELGKFSFLEVLDAQRTLFQAKSQYLRTLSVAHQSAAEIERILGDASPDSTLASASAKP